MVPAIQVTSGAFKILPRPVRTDICPALDCSAGFPVADLGERPGRLLPPPILGKEIKRNHGQKKKTGLGQAKQGLDMPLLSAQTKSGSPIYCLELLVVTACHRICDKQNP